MATETMNISLKFYRKNSKKQDVSYSDVKQLLFSFVLHSILELLDFIP